MTIYLFSNAHACEQVYNNQLRTIDLLIDIICENIEFKCTYILNPFYTFIGIISS